MIVSLCLTTATLFLVIFVILYLNVTFIVYLIIICFIYLLWGGNGSHISEIYFKILIFLKPFVQEELWETKTSLICRTPVLTNHKAVHPAVSQIRIFSMKNDHEKGFSSICFSSLPFLSFSLFTTSLCLLLFFHFLCASLHFFIFSLSPSLFPLPSFSFPRMSVYWGQVDVSGIHFSLFNSVYFPHARSHMGFSYEQKPGKCKTLAHMHCRTVSHLVLLLLLY